MKYDILPVSAAGYKGILNDLRNMPVYTYRRYDAPNEPEIGVISEEAPFWIRGLDDKSVVPSRWLGFLTGIAKEQDRNTVVLQEAVKELKSENEALKKRVRDLEQDSRKK